MKTLYLFIFLFLSNSMNGQLPDLENKVNLNSFIDPTEKSEKIKKVEELRGFESLDWIFYTIDRGSYELLDFLHFVDFNKDGIEDIIYSGFIGGESDCLILFQGSSKKNYNEILKVFGRLVEVSNIRGDEPFSFTVYNYACCAGVVNHLEKYVPVGGELTSYELEYKFAFYYSTDIPKSGFITPTEFSTINKKYYLRLNPFIDNEVLLDHEEKGNIFAEYPPNSKGLAIAEKSDTTGRVWWFVIMNNNIEPNWSLYSRGDNGEDSAKYIGWISSRYVKEIKVE